MKTLAFDQQTKRLVFTLAHNQPRCHFNLQSYHFSEELQDSYDITRFAPGCIF